MKDEGRTIETSCLSRDNYSKHPFLVLSAMQALRKWLYDCKQSNLFCIWFRDNRHQLPSARLHTYSLHGQMLQSCQAAFRLMQELERRVIPEESLNNNQHMSIINIISNDELTLVQGVNGLFFCEESWVTQSRAVSRIGKVLPKEIIGTKDQSTNIVHPQTDRTKLSCQKHETSYF